MTYSGTMQGPATPGSVPSLDKVTTEGALVVVEIPASGGTVPGWPDNVGGIVVSAKFGRQPLSWSIIPADWRADIHSLVEASVPAQTLDKEPAFAPTNP